ncbi:apolipoprotein D-like [Pecten maximus]|uniref:apolipoprotein D-like n=1 Tax=Pecten maximus TaxID=6579 RepID=UPI001458E8F7|nr:apolipoprotein D-like [Pecten maximus]
MAAHVEVLVILVIAVTIIAGFNTRLDCPSVPVISNFNPKKYAGIWYEIERFDNPLQQNTTCISFKYCPKKNGDMRVSYSRLEQATQKVKTKGILRNVYCKPNHFKLYLENINGLDQDVIYTDYKNHAVLYGCDNATKLEWAFILSRTRKPIKRKRRLYRYLKDLGAGIDQLVTSDQTGCDAICSKQC